MRRRGIPPDRRGAEYEALALELAGRPVFWAELGLVSSPALLLRMGEALVCAAAGGDEELSQALGCATRHVHEGTVVCDRFGAVMSASARRTSTLASADLPFLGSGAGACATAGTKRRVAPNSGELPRAQSEGDVRQHASAFGLRWSAGPTADHWPIGDTSSDDSFDMEPFDKEWVALLPGRRSRSSCMQALLALLAVGVAVCVALLALLDTHYFYKGRQAGFWKLGVNVDYLNSASVAVCRLPAVLSIRSMVGSADTRRLLRELERSTGGACQVRQSLYAPILLGGCIFACGVFFSLMFADVFSEGPGVASVVHSGIWVVLDVAAYVFYVAVFFTCNLVDALLDQLGARIGEADSAADWAALSREYTLISQRANALFTRSMFDKSAALYIANGFWQMLWCFAFGSVDQGMLKTHLSMGFLKALTLGSMMIKIGKVHSKCVSRSPSNNSLFFRAMQHCGRLDPSEALSHHCFVSQVQMLPLGVEMSFLGVLTQGRVLLLLRLMFAVVPACIGVARVLLARS